MSKIRYPNSVSDSCIDLARIKTFHKEDIDSPSYYNINFMIDELIEGCMIVEFEDEKERDEEHDRTWAQWITTK